MPRRPEVFISGDSGRAVVYYYGADGVLRVAIGTIGSETDPIRQHAIFNREGEEPAYHRMSTMDPTDDTVRILSRRTADKVWLVKELFRLAAPDTHMVGMEHIIQLPRRRRTHYLLRSKAGVYYCLTGDGWPSDTDDYLLYVGDGHDMSAIPNLPLTPLVTDELATQDKAPAMPTGRLVGTQELVVTGSHPYTLSGPSFIWIPTDPDEPPVPLETLDATRYYIHESPFGKMTIVPK